MHFGFYVTGTNSPACATVPTIELAAASPVVLPSAQWRRSILLPFPYFGHPTSSSGITGHTKGVVHLAQEREGSSVSFISDELGCRVSAAAGLASFAKVASCSGSSGRRRFRK